MPNPEDYLLKIESLNPVVIRDDVIARKGSIDSWKVLTGQSIASVVIPIGKSRAPHLHTNTSEIVTVTQGTGRAGLLTPSDGVLEFEITAREVCFFPLGWPHWLTNTGSTPLECYFNYVHERPQTIELVNIKSLLQSIVDSSYLDTE